MYVYILQRTRWLDCGKSVMPLLQYTQKTYSHTYTHTYMNTRTPACIHKYIIYT